MTGGRSSSWPDGCLDLESGPPVATWSCAGGGHRPPQRASACGDGACPRSGLRPGAAGAVLGGCRRARLTTTAWCRSRLAWGESAGHGWRRRLPGASPQGRPRSARRDSRRRAPSRAGCAVAAAGGAQRLAAPRARVAAVGPRSLRSRRARPPPAALSLAASVGYGPKVLARVARLRASGGTQRTARWRRGSARGPRPASQGAHRTTRCGPPEPRTTALSTFPLKDAVLTAA